MMSMLTRADDLAQLTVLDERGTSVRLGELWRERTAVLVFLRHFGCIHCREHVVQLRREAERLARPDVHIVIVGNGSPSFIAGLREQTGWTGPVYTDPTLAAYRAAQLKRGVVQTIDPRGWLAAAKSLAAGRKQGRTQGDQWQQGGVVVVAPSGEVRWHHASEYAGDNASAQAIAAAL
jgi:peroxiredoxin